jgi:hypothetical protein
VKEDLDKRHFVARQFLITIWRKDFKYFLGRLLENAQPPPNTMSQVLAHFITLSPLGLRQSSKIQNLKAGGYTAKLSPQSVY